MSEPRRAVEEPVRAPVASGHAAPQQGGTWEGVSLTGGAGTAPPEPYKCTLGEGRGVSGGGGCDSGSP